MALPEFPQSRNELWLNEVAGHLYDTTPDDPQSRIEEWLSYIAGNTSGMADDIAALQASVADPYDPTQSYTAGDFAMVGGVLKQANADTSGEYDPTKWDDTTVAENLGGGGRTAAEVSVADAGGYFTSDNVEGVLQEVGETIGDVEEAINAIRGVTT